MKNKRAIFQTYGYCFLARKKIYGLMERCLFHQFVLQAVLQGGRLHFLTITWDRNLIIRKTPTADIRKFK